jgi:hypothetical protein
MEGQLMNRYHTLLVFLIQLIVVLLVVRRVWKRAAALKKRRSPVDGSEQSKTWKRAGKAEAPGTRETLEESLAKHRRQMDEELAKFVQKQKSANN